MQIRPGNMSYIMRTIRLSLGNMSLIIHIIHIRNTSDLKDLDHHVGVDDLSEV